MIRIKCYNFLKDQEDRGFMLGNKFIIGGGLLYNYIYSNYLSVINKVYETFIKNNN